MDKYFRYIVMIFVFAILLIFGGLFAFHHHVYHSVDTYASQNYQLLNELKNNELIDNNQIEHAQNKTTEEYNNFLKSYYETQNNWLNYWLTIMGMLLTIMMIIIPYVFSRRWKDEKDEINYIKKEFNDTIKVAEEKLNRLDVNQVKQEIDNIIANKTAELKETTNLATDDLWNKQEELVLSIKRTVIEDILKNGPDSEFFVDKITDKVTKNIEQVVDAKLEGVDYERD